MIVFSPFLVLLQRTHLYVSSHVCINNMLVTLWVSCVCYGLFKQITYDLIIYSRYFGVYGLKALQHLNLVSCV